jgi:hypothetical protein
LGIGTPSDAHFMRLQSEAIALIRSADRAPPILRANFLTQEHVMSERAKSVAPPKTA